MALDCLVVAAHQPVSQPISCADLALISRWLCGSDRCRDRYADFGVQGVCPASMIVRRVDLTGALAGPA
jgi:hypothetical protein